MGRNGIASSRTLVIALAVAVALVSYNINIPAGRSSASNWKFVATHPTVVLHIIVAAVILVLAVVMLIMAVRERDRSRVIVAAAGLAFVLLAFAAARLEKRGRLIEPADHFLERGDPAGRFQRRPDGGRGVRVVPGVEARETGERMLAWCGALPAAQVGVDVAGGSWLS